MVIMLYLIRREIEDIKNILDNFYFGKLSDIDEKERYKRYQDWLQEVNVVPIGDEFKEIIDIKKLEGVLGVLMDFDRNFGVYNNMPYEEINNMLRDLEHIIPSLRSEIVKKQIELSRLEKKYNIIKMLKRNKIKMLQ
ncbi:hypothetical protein [Caldisericum sp.]|uniref:hypothetical protein n=1 Tax=Caldisericum sp. TaxID=2499687 RepID=UPI003D0CFA95